MATSRRASTLQTGVLRVRRFTEKPNQEKAEEFVAAGNYYWNSGIFLWSARTLANAMREHLPETSPLLEKIAAAYGTPQFERCSPSCIRNAKTSAWTTRCLSRVLRRASIAPIFFASRPISDGTIWDRGRRCTSISSSSNRRAGSTISYETADALSIDAHGNYVYSPEKFVALVGVKDLVVVETGDALLITSRSHSQDVGKIVKQLGVRRARPIWCKSSLSGPA